MDIDRGDVTEKYPALLGKNLRRGERGNVRAVELVDVTEELPKDARVRRKNAAVVVAYAKDLAGNWYAQIARAFVTGNSVVLVAIAKFPALRFEEGDEAVEEVMGFASDDLRDLIRRRVPDCVPETLNRVGSSRRRDA